MVLSLQLLESHAPGETKSKKVNSNRCVKGVVDEEQVRHVLISGFVSCCDKSCKMPMQSLYMDFVTTESRGYCKPKKNA